LFIKAVLEVAAADGHVAGRGVDDGAIHEQSGSR
jgi:hypothetical protein